jgi:hypothetical protein
MSLNEVGTRTQLIDMKLNESGWTLSNVTREHYYWPNLEFTDSRIVLRGDRAERLPTRQPERLQVRMGMTGIDAPNDYYRTILTDQASCFTKNYFPPI